ncbi:MAG TPA: PepSY-associated TM helix domain-containing protein [Bryobacteraceae bacterium]|nr:PepSY-associated TM helix domain-containing protein [Bryobacteraceae bacterium]
MRKAIFWVHLACGVVAGAIVLLMSVTGVLLTYERQMLAWSDRGPYRSPSAPSERPSVEAALADKGLLLNGNIVVRADGREPIEISRGREGATYIEAGSGRVLGESKRGGLRGFFGTVVAWHRWLGAEGAGRQTGKAITGACNLAFLGLVLTGAYLWLPRVWRWTAVRQVVLFRGGLSGKARDFNWHNVLGIWCFLPLLVVVAGAVPISYTWASNLVYSIGGGKPPAPPAAPSKPPGGSAPSPVILAGVDRLLARAEAQVPGWQSITFRIPPNPATPIVFTIDEGNGGQPQKRGTLTLDRTTAEVVRWEPFSSLDAGRQIRMWLRFLHTGEALGIAGQTIAGIASAGAVVLVYTGIALSLRRFAAWRRRRTTAGSHEPAAAVR